MCLIICAVPKITEQLSRQKRIQNTAKYLRWRVLQKELCLSTGTQPGIFQDKGGFVELGHFDKHFVKNKGKKTPLGTLWKT